MGHQILLHGIFLTQGSNPNLPWLLRQQVGSLPPDRLGSPLRCKEVSKGDTAGRGGAKSQTQQGTLES